MNAEYACIYGISGPVPGLIAGEQITCFGTGKSVLTFHGKGGRVYWFVFKKLDRRYCYPDFPRFTKLDTEELGQSFYAAKVWGSVTFGEIWTRREMCSMTALEENVFQHWNFGRMVCLGDSMHPVSRIHSLSGRCSCSESVTADDPKSWPRCK